MTNYNRVVCGRMGCSSTRKNGPGIAVVEHRPGPHHTLVRSEWL